MLPIHIAIPWPQPDLQLEAITFNHNVNSVITSGVNLRLSKDQEVLLPEFELAPFQRPRSHPCAYSIQDTIGNDVTVELRFRISSTLAQISASTGKTLTFNVRADGGGVLGPIAPTAVTFQPGQPVTTVHASLADRSFDGVGAHNVTWEWSAWQAPAGWRPLTITSHRVYLLLDTPKTPWTATFASRKNVWANLLDHACAIANEAQTSRDALRPIVKALNGDYLLKYDIVRGAPRYGFSRTGSQFRLDQWMSYVLDGNAPTWVYFCEHPTPGSTHAFGTLAVGEWYEWLTANCYDCASGVAILGAALGCPTAYVFHEPFGYLNPVYPIGRDLANNPFPGCRDASGIPALVGPDDARTSFGNHTYVVAAGENYDACLKEKVPWWKRAVLRLRYGTTVAATLGTSRPRHLLDWADGYLVQRTQADYEAAVIDTSAAFEAANAGGAPSPQVLDFSTA